MWCMWVCVWANVWTWAFVVLSRNLLLDSCNPCGLVVYYDNTWTEQKWHILNPTINTETWERTTTQEAKHMCLGGKAQGLDFWKESWFSKGGLLRSGLRKKKGVWKKDGEYPDKRKNTGSWRLSWRSTCWVDLNAGGCLGTWDEISIWKQLCSTSWHDFFPG